jgi:hypothetical protein
MKLQKIIITASLLLAAGYGSMVSAHTQSGALGSAATGNAATDIYNVTCSNDGSGAPAKLFVQVKDLAPVLAPLVSVQASKSTLLSLVSTDGVDGDANYSAGVTVAGGAGTYIMKVTKSASAVKGLETYVAQFHCQTSGGVHTGTTWAMTQNQ